MHNLRNSSKHVEIALFFVSFGESSVHLVNNDLVSLEMLFVPDSESVKILLIYIFSCVAIA